MKLVQDKSVPKQKAAAPLPAVTTLEKTKEAQVSNEKDSADIKADPEEQPQDATETVKAAA